MRLVFLAHVEQELTFYLTLCRSLFILWKVPVDWRGKSDVVRYCPNQTRRYHATSITCFLWSTEGIVVFAHDVNGTAGLPIQTYKREEKQLWTGFFNLQKDDRHRNWTTVPGAKLLLQLTFRRPYQRFIVVFRLKIPSMLGQNLSFARPSSKRPTPPLYLVFCGRKRRQDVLPASLFAIFRISGLFSCTEVKSELASCLLTQVTFKKSLYGVAPTIPTEEFAAVFLR